MLLAWVKAIIKAVPLGWYFERPQGGDSQPSEGVNNEQLTLPI